MSVCYFVCVISIVAFFRAGSSRHQKRLEDDEAAGLLITEPGLEAEAEVQAG